MTWSTVNALGPLVLLHMAMVVYSVALVVRAQNTEEKHRRTIAEQKAQIDAMKRGWTYGSQGSTLEQEGERL